MNRGQRDEGRGQNQEKDLVALILPAALIPLPSFPFCLLPYSMKRRLTVEAVVIDPRRGVLLVKQGRTRYDWELPGGKVKRGEFIVDAVVREVMEETAIDVKATHLLGVYFIGAESTLDFVFVCRSTRKNDLPFPNPPEIAECGFFPVDALPSPMKSFTRRVIADALAEKVQPLPVSLSPAQWLG